MTVMMLAAHDPAANVSLGKALGILCLTMVIGAAIAMMMRGGGRR